MYTPRRVILLCMFCLALVSAGVARWPGAAAYADDVLQVLPTSAYSGDVVSLTISGPGLTDATAVSLLGCDNGYALPPIVAFSVAQMDQEVLACDFDLTDAVPGAYCVLAENSDGSTARLSRYAAEPFTVTLRPPTVIAVTPSSAVNTGPVDVEISGGGFLQGARVALPGWADTYDPSPPCTRIWGTEVVVESDSLIRCRFDITGAVVGQHCLAVQNPDGQWCEGPALMVQAPPPTVTGIAPASAPNTGPVEMEITGTGFYGIGQVEMCGRGQGLTSTEVTVVSSELIRCRFDLTGQTVGRRGIWVRRSDGLSGSLCAAYTNAFYVSDGANPGGRITSIEPNPVCNDGPHALTIRGGNFADSIYAAAAWHYNDASDTYESISCTHIWVVSPSELQTIFDFTGWTPGTWGLVLWDATGLFGLWWDEPGALQVVEAPPPPTVTGVTPGSAPNSGPVDVQIAGTGFAQGAQVVMSCGTATGSGPSVGVTDVVVEGDTLIRCRFDVTGAALGKHCIAVQNPDGQWGGMIEALEVTEPAPLAVTAISPSWAPNTGPVELTITGTGFYGAMDVHMCRPGDGLQVNATDVTVVSSTEFHCRLGLKDQPTGKRSVRVIRADGQFGHICAGRPDAFCVGDPYTTPRVTGISPNPAFTTGPVELTVSGANFADNIRYAGILGGTNEARQGSNIQVMSPEEIRVTFDLWQCTPGKWTLIIFDTAYNAFGLWSDEPGALELVAPPLTLASVSPSSVPNTGPADLEITGTGFLPGMLPQFRVPLLDGRCAVVRPTQMEVVSSTLLRGRFDFTGAAPGKLCMAAGTPDGRSTSRGGLLEVVDLYAPLTVTSVDPLWAPNTGPATLHLAGTGFCGDLRVRMCAAETEIWATDVEAVSTELLSCTFDLTGQPNGGRTIYVARLDGASAVFCAAHSRRFCVSDGPYSGPMITGVSPNPALNNGSVVLTIQGTDFPETLHEVWIHHDVFGDWRRIRGTDAQVVSATDVQARFDLTGVPPGTWGIVVWWTSSTNSCLWYDEPGALEIVQAPPPTVTAVTPSSGLNNGPLDVEIAGTGFALGACVRLTGWGESGPDDSVAPIAATDVVVESESLIRCRLDLTGAAPGLRSVSVTNPDGQTGSLSAGFEVIKANPVPQIAGVSPTETTAGDAAFELAVTGFGFVEGSVVRWSGSDRPTTFVSETELRAQIATEDVAVAGVFDITVFSPPPAGGESSILQFTVNNPVPAVSAISPTWAVAGRPAFTLTVTGANFVTDSVVQWNGEARPTTFTSDTQVTAQIPATDIATGGTADVTVASPAPGGGVSDSAEFVIRKPCVLAYNRDTSNRYGQPLTLQALLTSGGTPVEGILVRFRVTSSGGTGEWSYSATTDADGLATVAVGAIVIPVGTYTVACHSQAALGYHSASTSAVLTVHKAGPRVDTYVVLENGSWPAAQGSSTLRFFFSENAPAGWFEFTDRTQSPPKQMTAHTVTAIQVVGRNSATVTGRVDGTGRIFTLTVDAASDRVVVLEVGKTTLVKNQRLSSGDIQIYRE